MNKLVRKSTAAKEISDWARSRNEAPVPSVALTRDSGLLATNVTEAKMLQQRVYDLSKQRYKHIKEREYQKNRFIDRQQIKAKTLKHLLDDINIDQYRSRSTSAFDNLYERQRQLRTVIMRQRFGKSFDEDSCTVVISPTLTTNGQPLTVRPRPKSTFTPRVASIVESTLHRPMTGYPGITTQPMQPSLVGAPPRTADAKLQRTNSDTPRLRQRSSSQLHIFKPKFSSQDLLIESGRSEAHKNRRLIEDPKSIDLINCLVASPKEIRTLSEVINNINALATPSRRLMAQKRFMQSTRHSSQGKYNAY